MSAYSRGEYGCPATGPGSSPALFCVRCREGGRRMEKSCRLFDLGDKEVIDLQSGARLGYIYDAEIDLETGRIRSFFTPGRARFFGLLGREEDACIPWENVEKIGDDIILVRRLPALPSLPPSRRSTHRRRF